MPSSTRPSSRPGSPACPVEPTQDSQHSSELRWNSCHIPAFTSTFGFASPSGPSSNPKRDFDAMETGDTEGTPGTEDKNSLCVRHERLRADYKRLKTEESGGEGTIAESTTEEEEANLQEVRNTLSLALLQNRSSDQPYAPWQILSTLSSTETALDNEAIQKTFETFAQASHQTRTLILHGLLSTCCYSQLSLLRDKLGESVSARPGSNLSSSQGPPCDTPGASTSKVTLTSRNSGADSSNGGKMKLLALPSPARADPLIILPLELSTRIFSYLDARDLCTAAQVCKRWKEVSEDDALWKAVYVRTFGGVKAGKAKGGGSAMGNSAGGAGFFLVEGRDGGVSPPRTTTISRYTASGISSFRRPSLQSFRRHSSWKSGFKSRRSTTLNWAKGVPAYTYSLRPSWSNTAKTVITCLQVDWEERIVVAGSEDGTVRVWNLHVGGEEQAPSESAESELRRLTGHTASVRALQFDKVKLITGSLDGSMKVWDWRTGRCVRTLTVSASRACDCGDEGPSSDGSYRAGGSDPGVLCLQFDDDVLVNGSTDGAVRVWDLKRACVDTLRGHGVAEVTAIKIWSGSLPCLTRVGARKFVLSASADWTIKLWDVGSRSCLRTFAWHLARVTSLAFVQPASPWLNNVADGPVLVSASLDNSLGVWDIDAAKCIQTLLGHTQGVAAVATDGVRVVSASCDSTVRVWNAKGDCIMTLEGNGPGFSCVQVGEEGIVCGLDGEVKVWSFAG